MLSRTVHLLLLASLACAPSTSPAPAAAESGAYLIRLGTDTIAVDQYVRAGNRIEGTVVQRAPRAMVTKYVVNLNPNGTPASIETATRLPDGSLVPNGPRNAMVTFTGDSAIARVERDTTVITRAGAHMAFPFVPNAYSLYGLPIAAMRAAGRDSALYAVYPAGARQTTALAVARKGSNAYRVYLGDDPYEITTDDGGRVLSVDGARATQHIIARREGPVDVAAIATQWAERERLTRVPRMLSPRDTVTAMVGAARLWVDYSRPALRGRRVFGADGVLGDTIWRTGANAATQFRTSAPLTIAGKAVPAGTYTLWTVAMPGRYQLIVNKQVGQWGTSYDPTQDLIRVPLQSAVLPQPVEQFTIDIEPSGSNGGLLRLRWDTMELSVPLTTP